MIYSTHDIDWLNPAHPIGVVKWLVRKPWVSFRQLAQNDLFLKQTERLLLFQQAQNISGIFMIGMQANGRSCLPKAIRYSYKSSLLVELLSMIKTFNQPIGLHHHPNESIQIQAERFLSLTGSLPKYVRGHYFSALYEKDLMLLKSMNCQIDFGYGSRTDIGYPNNATQTGPIKQVATIFSDNNIIQYQRHTHIWDDFGKALEQTVVKNMDGAILFHPENFAVYPHLFEDYMHSIRLIRDAGITIYR